MKIKYSNPIPSFQFMWGFLSSVVPLILHSGVAQNVPFLLNLYFFSFNFHLNLCIYILRTVSYHILKCIISLYLNNLWFFPLYTPFSNSILIFPQCPWFYLNVRIPEKHMLLFLCCKSFLTFIFNMFLSSIHVSICTCRSLLLTDPDFIFI